jgi:hypothetical protein
MFVKGNISLPWIQSFICQVLSPGLEELTVSIKTDNMEDLRALDSECGVRDVSPVRFEDLPALNWERIESTLEENSGIALKRIVMEGQGDIGFLQAHLAQYPHLARVVRPPKAR